MVAASMVVLLVASLLRGASPPAAAAVPTVSPAGPTAVPLRREPASTGAYPAGAIRVSRARIFIGPHERTFLVFAPATLARGAPLVLAFHGGGGSGERFRGFVGAELERLAEAHGFLIIYPDGLGGHWNDCRAASPYPARRRRVDDVSFVRGLIRWSEGRYGVDADRVVALGFSNGGHFALRLALETPADVSAVAAIGASLPVPEQLDCETDGKPASIMLINGTGDPINPYDGGQSSLPDGTTLGAVRAAGESARALARIAGQRGKPRSDELLPRRSDGTGVTRTTWQRPGRPRVALVIVHGGGHTVPGTRATFPDFLGATEREWDALADIVAFLLPD